MANSDVAIRCTIPSPTTLNLFLMAYKTCPIGNGGPQAAPLGHGVLVAWVAAAVCSSCKFGKSVGGSRPLVSGHLNNVLRQQKALKWVN